MVNKYRKAAAKFAMAICDLMNLLYKADASADFRHELLLQIQNISYDGKKWRLKGGNHG